MIYKYIKLCHPKSLDTVLDTLFDTVFLRGYIKIYEILTILIFKKQDTSTDRGMAAKAIR